jgi:restriction system protein
VVNVFCVRAEFGRYTSAFIKGNYVAIGWLPRNRLSDLKPADTDKLRELYMSDYPQASPLSAGQNLGQISRFLFEIQQGDIVVTPTLENEKLAVGRVTSQYYYKIDSSCPFPHRKTVEWRTELVLRPTLSIPLQNTLRSSLTVYRVGRGDEIAYVAGYELEKPKVAHVETDLYHRVLEQFMELSADEFEILVKELLASIGFDAEHIGRQGDGGIDVTGDLKVYEFASVDLYVQVKRYSLDSKIGPKAIRDFRGSVPEKSQGAFVTTCSFNKKSYEEAVKPGFKRIGLIDGRKLVDIMVDHYDNLSPELRGKLRLRKTLVPEE